MRKAFSPPMYSATSYSDAYQTLTPVAQYCALVCGVFHPHHVTMTKLVETLAFAELRSERKRINSAQVRAAVKELANADIVIVDRSGAGGNIDESWAPWLTMEANRSGKLEKLRDALRHGYGYWSYYRSPETRAMDVRCLSVLGRFTELTDNYPDVNADDWRFLAEPGALELLPNVPAQRLPAALNGCLSQVIDGFAEPEPVIDACKQLAPDLALCLSDIAFIRILQGRLDDAGSIFDDMEQDPRELHRSKIEALGGRALIATLRGDDDRAAAYIDAAVAEEKKGTRKRNVFPASRAFALSTLSLLRRNSPASLTLLEQLVRAASRNGAEPYIMSLVAAAAGMEYRQPVHSRYYGKSPLYLFLFELSTCWKGGRDLLNRKLLAQIRRRARVHGFKWIEAECIELVSGHKGGPDAKQQGVLSGANHADLGTVSLASLVQPAPEWEQRLKEMERFSYELEGKRKPGPKKSRSRAQQRLAWDFEAKKYEGIVLTPRLQRANKEGVWSMGRTLTPKQLLTQASTMDFLLEQDRAAISTIKQEKHKWRGQKRFYLPVARRRTFQNSGARRAEVAQGEYQVCGGMVPGIRTARPRPWPDAGAAPAFCAAGQSA